MGHLSVVQRRSLQWMLLVVVAAWGALQTFWHLGRASLQSDEYVYWNAGWAYVHGIVSPNMEHPPFAKDLMGWTMLLFGPGVNTARLLVAVLSFATGVVIFLWLRRDVGWWTATLGAGMWWVLPRGIDGDPSRIDRLALLDGPMVAFLVASLWCGWRWASGGRLWWLIPAGALFALAVTSKEAAAAVAPSFILLGVLAGVRRRPWWGALTFAAIFGAVFLLVYHPIGVVTGIRYMVTFQAAHARGGHLVTLAGHTYTFAPWWANLWFQWRGTGGLVTTVLALGLLAAIALRPTKLVMVLAAPAVCFLVFFCFISDVALGEYYIAWMPWLIMLAAVGFTQCLRRVRPRWVGIGVAGALVLALGFAGGRQSLVTKEIRPMALARVQPILDGLGKGSANIVGTAVSPASGNAYFPARYATAETSGTYQAIIVGVDSRMPANEALLRFLHQHAAAFSRWDLDGTTLYVPHDGLVDTDGTRFAFAAEPAPSER